MITSEQIRAARALLGWSQKELSLKTGLSTTAINQIERGDVKPRISSLDIIQKNFVSYGVKFFGDYGVDLKKDVFNIEVWEGRDAIERYLIDVIETVKGTGLIPVHFNFNDELWVKHGHGPIYHQFFKNMIRYGITEKVLVREGDIIRYAPYETSEYRWFPQELAGQIGYSVYGDKYAIFALGKVDKVIVIENPMMAELYHKQFMSLWAQAKKQPKVNPLFDQNN